MAEGSTGQVSGLGDPTPHEDQALRLIGMGVPMLPGTGSECVSDGGPFDCDPLASYSDPDYLFCGGCSCHISAPCGHCLRVARAAEEKGLEL